MTVMTPTISVVMSVYNGAPYLRYAIDSIIAQSFKDFEFIIINDGSTDETADILRAYTDKRIRVITQSNKGLVASLNRGIKMANGKYIARQDADDISNPDRFDEQVKFLQSNPKIVLIGSSMSVMDEGGNILHKHSVLLHDPELKQELLVRSPFAHGSVMFKRQAAIDSGLYRHEYWPAEDYDLWLKLSTLGEFANIDKYNYVYREHSGGISATNQQAQTEMISRIQNAAWTQRNKLVTRRRIRLANYKNVEHSSIRIERILANVARASRTASRRHDLAFAIKNASLIAGSPLAYRKTAGMIRRRNK